MGGHPYDANDARIHSSGSSKYYGNGANGQTEAVVDVTNPGVITHNIWGNDLVGQVRRNGGLTRYYHLKDHLGSIRVTVDAAGNAVAYDDYDPWGMLMDGRSYNAGQVDARYKFTCKEKDTETGLDYFGARYYDSRIGRWMSVDPLAEKYLGWSPYNYTFNNPTGFVDPDGRNPWAIAQGYGMLFKAAVAATVVTAHVITYNTNPAYKNAVDQTNKNIATVAREAFNSVSQLIDAAIGSIFTAQQAQDQAVTQTSGNAQTQQGTQENTNPYVGPVTEPVTVVDPAGNAIPVGKGEQIKTSPDGTWVDVKDSDGKTTGIRIDGGHKPGPKHPDPRSQKPHGHRPDVRNPDGTPWLPIKE